jgi:hypothetical protein
MGIQAASWVVTIETVRACPGLYGRVRSSENRQNHRKVVTAKPRRYSASMRHASRATEEEVGCSCSVNVRRSH